MIIGIVIGSKTIRFINRLKMNDSDLKIDNLSGKFEYLCMQAFPNYNYKTFPYVLIKDTQSLNVINVKTMQSRVILDNSPYSWAGVQSSLMDFKVD
jgi:hypothetical protein